MSLAKQLLPGLVFALALALLVLGPSFAQGGLLGHEALDNWSHAWGMHWFVDSLAHGRLPWTLTGAAHPEHRVLYYVDPLGAVISAPLQLLSPAIAYNGLQLVQLTLLGFCAWGFARAVGGKGWLAAAAMVTLPLLQTELHNGVVEACWMAPMAATGWAAAKRSKWTGVFMGLAAIGTPYHGVGAALIGGTLLLMGGTHRGGSWPERLRDLALAAGLSILLALPHYAGMSAAFDSPHAFVNRPLFDAFNDPSLRVNATDPRALWTPGDFWSRAPNLDNPLAAPWKHTPYLSWVLMLATVLGLRSERRWAWLLLPAAVLLTATLGFYLWQDEAWVRNADGRRYALPLYWVSKWSRVSLVHHMRFAGGLALILAALADRSLSTWRPVLWGGAALVLTEHLFLAPGAWPVPTSPSGLPPAYEATTALPGGVIDLPADSGKANRTNRYLYWNALHGRPVPWVNKVGNQGTASSNAALRTWVLLSKEDRVIPGSPGVPDPDADLSAAAAELKAQGYSVVLLHSEMLAEPKLEQRIKRSLRPILGPGRQVAGGWMWAL